jgi:hypothetical protein
MVSGRELRECFCTRDVIGPDIEGVRQAVSTEPDQALSRIQDDA